MSTFINGISNCCYYIRRKMLKRQRNTNFDDAIFPHENRIIYNKYRVNPITVIKFNEKNVVNKIGEGGSATVYKYIDNKKEYACKKLTKNRNSIEREINIMKSYKAHKHLPTYFDSYINTSDNLKSSLRFHYIFMEYCQGRELFELIQPDFDYKLATNIIYQLITAVKHLQKYNIIHSDIKLENIIIDQNNQIKLIDFGLSQTLPEYGNCVRLNRYIGTIGYISPESVLLNYVNLKTDIWSIGILYYILLNNHHIFNVLNINKYKTQIAHMHSLKINRFNINNNTLTDSKTNINIISFLTKTICYEKNRYTIKECLNSNAFKKVVRV
jgi:non-specific serine/threonine protein kinase